MSAPDSNDARGEVPGSKRRLRLLLAAVLIHGLAYWLLLPPWMGEDEPWHFENVTHVANGHGGKSDRDFKWDDQEWAPLTQGTALRRFSGLELEEAARVQREILASMNRESFWKRVDWTGRSDATESFDQVAMGFSTAQQPPLYYFLAAPIVALSRGARLEVQLALVRLLSLALLVATVYLTYLASRVVFVGADDRPALLAAFFVGWFPMHARMAAVVNNDVLARFLVTLTLLLSLRLVARAATQRSRMHLLWVFVVCALSVATKTTAFSALPIAFLGFALMPREIGLPSRKWLLVPVVILLTVVAVLFWRSMNNPAVPYSLEQLAKRFDYALSAHSYIEIRDSFLGAFNWESRTQPGWIQTTFGVFLLAALGGSIFAIRRAQSSLIRRMLLVCFGAFGIQFALVLLRGVGKGRYLMPVIAALSILIVAGLVQALPERLRTRVATVLVLCLVGYDAIFLWSGLVANQYLVWGS